MAHALSVSVILGSGKSGLTLTASLLNPDGSPGPALTTTDMLEIAAGSGTYAWTGTVPDGFRGFIQFTASGMFQAAAALNPQETENADVRTSAVWDQARSAHTTAGSFGEGVASVQGNVTGSVASVAAAVDILQSAADKVWSSAARTLTGFGTLVADIWANATRTLTESVGGATAADIWTYATRTLTQVIAAVTPPPVLSGTTINVLRGETISLPFTGLGDLTGRNKLWFTVKRQETQPDSAALVQIEETAGLVWLDGAPGSAGSGSIAVTDAAGGAATVTIAAGAAAELPVGEGYFYDLQALFGATVKTLTTGSFTVTADVTRAVS